MALRGIKSPESDEIADSEDQAKPIDWESSDDINPVDDFYANRLKKAENDAVTDESDPDNIDDQEENPEPVPTRHVKKGRTRFDRIKRAVKRGGPTGGVIGVIVGTFGLSSVILGPSSLLVNLSSILGNHTDLGNHLFTKTGNSYIASVLKGEGRNCTTSKIKCKFTTVSEKRIKQWESRGIKVDVGDGKKNALGRYKVRGLEYKNNKVETIRQYKSLRYTNPEFNSLLKRFPVRAGYLNIKSSVNKSVAKFGKSLGSKFTSSKNKNKTERRTENSKKMNNHTGAKVDARGNIDPTKVSSSGQKNIDEANKKFQSKLKSFRSALTAAGTVGLAEMAACMGYNVIRATQAAVTLYWHSELIAFAIPFLQAGASAKQAGVEGEFDWETAEYYGDRLTQPITREMAEADDNDNITLDMVGKTAMDSKGIAAALHGDTSLNKDYAGWTPSVFGIGLVRDAQNAFGGDNIRTACIAAKYVVYASAVQCIPAFIKCFTFAIAQNLISRFWSDDIIQLITDKLSKPALEAIAKANLTDSLVGPPLGDALTSGAGVLGSYMDRSSGFAVASDNNQAYQAYNYMMTDEDYIQNQIVDAKQKASKNQFDPTNKYSFAGQFASKFSSVPWDGTLFSVVKNMTSAVSGLSNTSHAAKDGLFMPIETYKSKQSFNDTLANCEDFSLKELEIPCMGESGRTVPYILPDVQKCLDAEQNDNNKICIEDAIDYLSTKTYGKDDDKKPYIDEDTGKPSDWENYSKYKEGEKSDNPFLMFMAYCGSDREYPLGYTDSDIESDNDDWHVGLNCASDPKNKYKDITDTDLGWMSYYYNMCISLLASEEDQDYCWEESKTTTSVSGGDWEIPTSGPCTSPYGPRWGSLHAGIDIAPSEGTPIVAPTNMTITFAGFNSGGYGYMVTGKAEDGSDYSFRFGHMLEQPPVSVGDKVSKGETIGKVGNTGDSQGAHLHFEVFPPGASPATFSGSVDPVPILNGKGASISC